MELLGRHQRSGTFQLVARDHSVRRIQEMECLLNCKNLALADNRDSPALNRLQLPILLPPRVVPLPTPIS